MESSEEFWPVSAVTQGVSSRRLVSRRRTVLGGFILGFFACMILTATAATVGWQYRFRIASRLARPYAEYLAAQLFLAIPDGYVTKNRDRVILALDGFTNAVSRGQVSAHEIERVTAVLMEGLADGHLTYQELDGLLATMERAVGAREVAHDGAERP